MTALTSLRLDFNNFSGPMPPELFGLGQVWAAALPEDSMAAPHTPPQHRDRQEPPLLTCLFCLSKPPLK